MASPILTVCIPAYNQPALLHDTLTSLLDQGLHRDDYVVAISDDASTVPIADVAAAFRDRLHIVYDRNPQNIGHIKNWERSSQLTTTRYLSFLSHDDIVAPGHLRRALDVIESRPDVVLVPSLMLVQPYPGAPEAYVHGTFLTPEKASFTQPYEWDRTEWMALSLTGTPLSIIGGIFDAATFRKCDAWRGFPLWHDRLMLAEMGIHGNVVSLPWIGGYYRVGSFQLSGQLWTNDRREFREVSNVVLELSRHANLPVVDYWIDRICAASPEQRTTYLRMLSTSLTAPQFASIRGTCEQRLSTRLPLTRLERLRVPPALANLVRELDRVIASKLR